jgi:hypothetical protein
MLRFAQHDKAFFARSALARSKSCFSKLQGLNPGTHHAAFAAWLKPCPVTKPLFSKFFSTL